MREQIHIAGAEHEASAELERVLAEFTLLMAGGFGSIPVGGVVGTKKMKNVRAAQVGGAIGSAMFVDEQRKMNAGVLAEHAGVIRVGQADGGQGRASGFELVFVRAQLRGMLAAEDSTVVAQEHDDGGVMFPERAEADLVAVGIGQNDRGERFA